MVSVQIVQNCSIFWCITLQRLFQKDKKKLNQNRKPKWETKINNPELNNFQETFPFFSSASDFGSISLTPQ